MHDPRIYRQSQSKEIFGEETIHEEECIALFYETSRSLSFRAHRHNAHAHL